MSRSGGVLVVGVVAWAIAATGASAQGFDVEQCMAARASIEGIYASHRIWPAGHDSPKPAPAEVMPEAALRATVENDLLLSHALERIFGRAIGSADLQAEVERMAASTRAPGVLQEIFAALGNDPVLVAECLARPILSDRLMRSAYASDPRIHEELKTAIERSLARRPAVAELRREGEYVEAVWTRGQSERAGRHGGARTIAMDDESWQRGLDRLHAGFDAVPAWPRVRPGVEDLPLGILSRLQEDDESFFVQAVLEKGAARVKVATIAWRKTPFDEWWAGTKGTIASGTSDLAATTGVASLESLPEIAASNCTSDTWAAVQTVGAPSGRNAFSMVWTGTEMIIWGGFNGATNLDTNTGSRYNPATNSWNATATTGAPELRDSHSGVWTGSRMVIWGGGNEVFEPKNTGGRYNPATNTWQTTTTTSAPSARLYHTAVWADTRMIVWGGWNGRNSDLNTGARYDPVGDAWTSTTTTGAPTARDSHTAVWAGSRMIVWGGADDVPLPQNTGARYDPVANSWSATSVTNVPAARWYHTAVSTGNGNKMIVWGGFDGAVALNTGGLYDPATDLWTPTSTTGAPPARQFHVAVWADTASEMIVWGGQNDAVVPLSTGGRYNPAGGTWSATSNVNAPVWGRWGAANWTGGEMIAWGGWNQPPGQGGTDLNTGGGYCLGSCAAAAPGGASTISVGTSADLVSWSAITGADTYDLVRGSLSLLASSGGNFTTSLQACVANDQATTSVVDGAQPTVGSGFYYLVRGASCGGAGTYDTVGGNQVGSRDAEIAAAASHCP